MCVLAASLGSGCEVRRAIVTDSGARDAADLDGAASDARTPDALALDARPDDDAARDAPVLDGATSDGALDAGVLDAGVLDAGALDAGVIDAGAPDASVPTTRLECAVPVPAGPGSGIVLSSNIWSGFRFEITGGARIVGLGLEFTPEPGPGTVFGALVRLTGASDVPDDPALGGSDVLDVRSISVPSTGGAPVVAQAALDVLATPGWYAVVFGTGAFGATLTGGTIPSGGGGGCRALPGSGYPFSLRQSDGMFILQGAEPHMFVELAP